MPANDRIELALLRQFGQVAAECAQRRRLDVLLSTCRFAAAFLIRFRRREIRIELLQDLVTSPLDIDLKTLQNARRDTFTFTQQAKQNVFGADVGMIQSAFASLPASARTFLTRGV